jgi:tellurite resistance protein TerC
MLFTTAKKIVVSIIGGTILIIGLVLLVLPGPAFVVIPVGLSILATEYGWARFFLNKVKAQVNKVFKD